MAEWLRRLTRNQFPSGSAGSSPADCVKISLFLNFLLPLSSKCSGEEFLPLVSVSGGWPGVQLVESSPEGVDPR